MVKKKQIFKRLLVVHIVFTIWTTILKIIHRNTEDSLLCSTLQKDTKDCEYILPIIF